MGKQTKLRDLIGVIKDKASQSKAALLTKPKSVSLLLAVLRATTHSPSTPPEYHHVSALLSLGDSSRATASALVASLMDRLHRTGNSVVALKCLLVIHHVIKHGPFILQDQLSIFPTTGGRNYLKLSDFRDGATAITWNLSAWVRWYARYLETLLSTSRVLGFFLSSLLCRPEETKQLERVSSLLNEDLIRDVDSLVGVIEELCKVPDSLHLEGNKLLQEVMTLVSGDYISAVEETVVRLNESRERLNCLSFAESVELVCCLKKFETFKERLLALFKVKNDSMEMIWDLIGELNVRIGMGREGAKLLSKEKSSESARFGDRVMKSSDSVRFSSARFSLDQLSLVIFEPVHLNI